MAGLQSLMAAKALDGQPEGPSVQLSVGDPVKSAPEALPVLNTVPAVAEAAPTAEPSVEPSGSPEAPTAPAPPPALRGMGMLAGMGGGAGMAMLANVTPATVTPATPTKKEDAPSFGMIPGIPGVSSGRFDLKSAFVFVPPPPHPAHSPHASAKHDQMCETKGINRQTYYTFMVHLPSSSKLRLVHAPSFLSSAMSRLCLAGCAACTVQPLGQTEATHHE